MVDPELGLTVVFNGCIYNHKELRAELQSAGYRFSSTSDTEVILKAYHRWGDACVEHFLGMFALAVVEHESHAALLARDRLGIKPLYLARTPHRLRFSSTLPALLAGGTVEETLRYDPPVQLTARVARDEIQIGDVTATDGAVILVLLAATGRDPEVFAEPDRFDITRPAGGHLAFAAGPHFCLGAPLARLEASIAVTAFAQQLTGPALDGLSYKPNFNLRGPERLVARERSDVATSRKARTR